METLPFFILSLLAAVVIGSIKRPKGRPWTSTWQELASRTGLTYGQETRSGYNSPEVHVPFVYGEYRGRDVTIAKQAVTLGDYDKEEYYAWYTKVIIGLEGSSGVKVELKGKGLAEKLLGKRAFLSAQASAQASAHASAHDAFDRKIHVGGKPPDFVESLMALLVQGDPDLLNWILYDLPTITIDGSTLICMEDCEISTVDGLIGVLNLCCELAGLVEQAYDTCRL